MIHYFMQVQVTLSGKPIRFFMWLIIIAIVISPFYAFYRYIRKLHRQRQELILLQNDFNTKLFRAEIINQEQIFENISRDMHDNVGQKLALAKLYTLKEGFSADDRSEVAVLLQECMSEISRFSKSLGWNLVGELGLPGAIEEEVNRLQKVSLYHIDLKTTGEPVFLTPTIEIIFFRVFQEALQNVVKHSQATCVAIELMYEPAQLSLSLRDNGIGFDEKCKRNNGLRNMESRARSLNGSFSITPQNPGTQVLVKIPLLSFTKKAQDR